TAEVSPYGDAGVPPGADPAYPPARDAFSDRPTTDYGRAAPLSFEERQRLIESDQPVPAYDRRAPGPARRPGGQAAIHTRPTVAFVLGGIVLAAGLFAFAAWVWPGFWKKAVPVKGDGTEELWAFIPRDSNAFMALDLTVPLNAGKSLEPPPPGMMRMALQQV